jgi:hypothetical protein
MATPLKHATQTFAICFSSLCFFQFAARPVAAQTVPGELNIIVVQGEGAINHVRQSAASEPIVRIEDENHRPIAGATVVFTLPTEGATGQFANGSKMLVINTDAQGRVTAAGLKVNEYPGKLVILVGVSYRGLRARTTITQFDEGPPVAHKAGGNGGHGKLIAILVVVGGAAAGGGAYFATHKSGAASTTTSGVTPTGPAAIGLTPGTPTIIGPH